MRGIAFILALPFLLGMTAGQRSAMREGAKATLVRQQTAETFRQRVQAGQIVTATPTRTPVRTAMPQRSATASPTPNKDASPTVTPTRTR